MGRLDILLLNVEPARVTLLVPLACFSAEDNGQFVVEADPTINI